MNWKTNQRIRLARMAQMVWSAVAAFFAVVCFGAKQFHIRRVSSAPRDTTCDPSGLIARHKIRLVCPSSSVTLIRFGYLHMVN